MNGHGNKTWPTVLVLLLVIFTEHASGSVFSQKPGFRVMFTKKGLDYVFGPILKDGLRQLSIPDMEDEQRVTVVGKVKYSLSQSFRPFRVSVGEVTVPSTSLESRGDQLITIHISGMSLAMHAKWKYRQKSWPKIGDDGTVDLKAKDLSLRQTLSVRNDGNGQLAVQAHDCSFDVSGISVKFHGGASWLYNLFTSFIEGKIKDHLKSQVCKMVTDKINEFGRQLTSIIPLSVQVSDGGGEVSCALLGDPILTSSYLLTDHNGEYVSAEHPQEVPITPTDLPPPSSVDPTSKMAYIWLTSYTLDTAAYTYREAAYMEKHNEIPDLLLKTTTDYRSILPELYQHFPDMDMEYGMRTTQTPSLLLTPGQARMVGEAEASVFVLESTQPLLAFSLTVSLQFDVELAIETESGGQLISGNIKSFTTEIVSIDSNIGEFDSDPFRDLLHTLTRFLAIPHMNRILSSGITIPSQDGFAATNAVLSIEEGYILVGTDILYSV